MPKKQYDIDLMTFIRSLALPTFTVTDVTKQLLLHFEDKFEKKKNATQFVYRHLKQFTNDGLLITTPVENGKAIVFRWPETEPTLSERQKTASAQSRSSSIADTIIKLKEKIKFFEAEMLANMGEAEAYSEWSQEMPELAEDIKQLHQHTREQAKLMLGKVRGFERLLAFYEDRQK